MNRWIAGGLAALALGALAGGGVLLHRAWTRAAGEVPHTPTPSTLHREQPRAEHERKSPAEFGLPVHPEAFAFHSLVVDEARGSTGFSVRRGTAEDVGRFYRRELEARGWQHAWRRPATQELGSGRAVRGFRICWRKPAERRELTLLALDFPQKGTTVQAMLQWRLLEGRR